MAQIVDAPVDAVRAFLQERLNGHATFSAGVRDTLLIADGDCQAVNATYPCDPFTPGGFADAVASGNSAFPILGVFRADEEWSEWTWEQDKSKSTLVLRWILPADPNADRAWPLLRQFVRLTRILIQALSPNIPVEATSEYHAERAADRAALLAVGIWSLGDEMFKATYAYDGPNKQAAYPTVTLRMDFHCKEQWDPSHLANWTSFEGKYHLKGNGDDGDLDPTINPLVHARTPVSPT